MRRSILRWNASDAVAAVDNSFNPFKWVEKRQDSSRPLVGKVYYQVKWKCTREEALWRV